MQIIIMHHNNTATKTHPFEMPLTSFYNKNKNTKLIDFQKNIIIGNEYEFLLNFYDSQIKGHISVGNSGNTNGCTILCNHL